MPSPHDQRRTPHMRGHADDLPKLTPEEQVSIDVLSILHGRIEEEMGVARKAHPEAGSVAALGDFAPLAQQTDEMLREAMNAHGSQRKGDFAAMENQLVETAVLAMLALIAVRRRRGQL